MVAGGPGKVSQLPGPLTPSTLSLNRDLHEEDCLGTLFPDETCFM